VRLLASREAWRHTLAAVRQRGFTLIELMAAMLILALVITTTLAIFLERNRRLQQANETILAYQALANETEVRRRMDFANVDQPATFASDTLLLAPLAGCTTEVSVKLAQPKVKEVTLAVRWKSGQSDRSAVLTIVRTNSGGTNLW
jgi:prepilin-type N-terminal cleavage/methylation domain-containing protein